SASVTTTVSGGCVPPTIQTQPASVTNCPGPQVTFSVAANGSTLTYQWRKNGNPIPGATASSFTIPVSAPADAGAYDARITNFCGVLFSSTASLVINSNLAAQPLTSTTNCPGDTAVFTAVAAGTSLSYVWKKNGTILAGQTNASLAIIS